jgi:hypothetical protein
LLLAKTGGCKMNIFQESNMDMKTKNKENADITCAESYIVNSIIEKVRNGVMTDIILISHMSSLTMEQRLYLDYLWVRKKVNRKH